MSDEKLIRAINEIERLKRDLKDQTDLVNQYMLLTSEQKKEIEHLRGEISRLSCKRVFTREELGRFLFNAAAEWAAVFLCASERPHWVEIEEAERDGMREVAAKMAAVFGVEAK